MIDDLIIRAKVTGWVMADTVKTKVKNFFTEEKGGGEVVGAIVVIAIVVLLAVAFKDQLEDLMQKIWSGISGKESEIKSDMNIAPTPTTPGSDG